MDGVQGVTPTIDLWPLYAHTGSELLRKKIIKTTPTGDNCDTESLCVPSANGSILELPVW